MKMIPILAVTALAAGLVAGKPHAPHAQPSANPIRIHDVIGAQLPMPDFFGSILTTR